MRGAIGRAAEVLSPKGGLRVGQQIQTSGFYLAAFLCLLLAVLKLTIEGHWSVVAGPHTFVGDLGP